MYHQLAHLYDWAGSLDFAEKIRQRLDPLLAQQGLQPPARILDLACGTGTLALAMARQGYRVTGLDVSAAMLAQARQKQAQWAVPDSAVQWREGDMRDFVLDGGPVDAVLCHYDSLNHLSNETELRATFLQAAQALRPGGLFTFDLNTLENYMTFWNGSDTDEGPNCRIKTASRFDLASGKAEVRFWVDEYAEDGTLHSHSEMIQEQHFNEAAVEKYLQAADFTAIHWEPFNPVDELPGEFPLKTFWHCQRR